MEKKKAKSQETAAAIAKQVENAVKFSHNVIIYQRWGR